MTDTSHCCGCDTSQAFLDGYRHGLGDAASTLDHWAARASHPAIAATLLAELPPGTQPPEIIGSTLHSAANGLRTFSASVTLTDGPQQ